MRGLPWKLTPDDVAPAAIPEPSPPAIPLPGPAPRAEPAPVPAAAAPAEQEPGAAPSEVAEGGINVPIASSSSGSDSSSSAEMQDAPLTHEAPPTDGEAQAKISRIFSVVDRSVENNTEVAEESLALETVTELRRQEMRDTEFDQLQENGSYKVLTPAMLKEYLSDHPGATRLTAR